jgi:Ubiquitin carboxyl-terminal hydrolase/DUSP domain
LSNPVPVPVSKSDAGNDESSLYSLVSVVQHQGNFGGGHYVAHARDPEGGAWRTYSDACVTPVSVADVEQKEPYLLFFVRQPTPATSLLARSVLERLFASDSKSSEQIFVSRYWWHRFRHLNSPGPISNADILCDHGGVKSDLRSMLGKLVVKLSKEQYLLLAKTYGAAEPPLLDLSPCDCCELEKRMLEFRRQSERKKVTDVDTKDLENMSVGGKETARVPGLGNPFNNWYLISEVWLNSWRCFIENTGLHDGTGRGVLPPGPIDNARLLGKGGVPLRNLKAPKHYRAVNWLTWSMLYEMYGGGPRMPRKAIDIYETWVPVD